MDLNDIIKSVTECNRDLNLDEDSLETYKDKLKKQIHDLKSVIVMMEWHTSSANFGYLPEHPSSDDETPVNPIMDVDVILRNEIYKFAGFYCIKASKEEYIFNFSSSDKSSKDDTYVVQLFNKKGKISLGAWNMPVPIDLDDVITEHPIRTRNDMFPFIITCKHYIDCYFLRCKEYNKLKETVSNRKYIHLQSNDGYTQMILGIVGIYDKENNTSLNIDIHLIFNIDETSPYRIEMEANKTNDTSKNLQKLLHKPLMHFKEFDLYIAFQEMLNLEMFTCHSENTQDDQLKLNTTSRFNGKSYLEDLKSASKIKRQKTGKEEENSSQKNLRSKSKNNLKSVQYEHEEMESERNPQPFTNQTNTNITSGARVDKLKQTKLKFQLDNGPKLSVPNKNLDKPYTSTPMKLRNKNFNNITAASIDISAITVNNDIVDNTKTIKNNEFTGKRKREDARPSHISTTPLESKKKKHPLFRKKKSVLKGISKKIIRAK